MITSDYFVLVICIAAIVCFTIGAVAVVYLLLRNESKIIADDLIRLALKNNFLIGNAKVWTNGDQLRGVMYGAHGGGIAATKRAIILALEREGLPND